MSVTCNLCCHAICTIVIQTVPPLALASASSVTSFNLTGFGPDAVACSVKSRYVMVALTVQFSVDFHETFIHVVLGLSSLDVKFRRRFPDLVSNFNNLSIRIVHIGRAT